MKRSLNDHPVIVFIMVLAALCTIATFIIFIIGEIKKEQPDISSSEPPVSYSLDVSIVHYPNYSTNDLVVGGTWKLQGIHEAATSFLQAVRVYYVDDPQIEWPGNAKYGTCWSEEDNNPSNWSEPPLELDKLAQYDYPEGTFGTFSVDMTGISDIPSGSYICEVVIVINQERYEASLPFTFDGQTGGITDGTANEPQTPFFLDASIVHYPNISTGDLAVGGVWKLQNIHEDAMSFTQAVRVYCNDDPQTEWYGSAQYGTQWVEYEDNPSIWSETLMEVDELAKYDYPKGTFGTFSVDMADTRNIPLGTYTCELSIVINQEIYEISLPFTLE